MRVLVCRPREEADATARALAAAGHEAVLAPVLAIVPLPVALPAGPWDALVLTSRHALAGLAPEDAERLRARPVYAVGAATARAARQRGFADVRIGAGDAAGLSSLLALTLPPGRRLLLLAGRVHKPALPAALRAAGYGLTLCESYDAAPCGAWPDEVVDALRAGRLDAALHFSRRSAALALAAATQAGAGAAFLRLVQACLSEDVAAPLAAAGAALIRIARRPDEASLLDALLPRCR